jgi:hypothetical protein
VSARDPSAPCPAEAGSNPFSSSGLSLLGNGYAGGAHGSLQAERAKDARMGEDVRAARQV